MTTGWKQELGLAALLVCLAALAYGDLLRAGTTPYSPYSDIIAQHLAMKEVAYRSVQAGHGLPLWKSDLMGGGPALTHPQAVFTHPLQLLFLVLKPEAATGVSIWLHLLSMGLALQLLGGVLQLSLWARALMSVAGLFSFKLILMIYSGWLPVLPGFVCAPLLFAAVFRVMDRPSPFSALGLAAAGSLCLQSGHLQIFYYSLLFLGAYVAVMSVIWVKDREGIRARGVLLSCTLGGLLAAAGAAYLLLPLAAETGLTSRIEASYEFFLARGQYPPSLLSTFLHPEAHGTPLTSSYERIELWEDVAYFGAIPQALALFGAILGWRRPHVRFLSLGLFASVALVFDSPVLRLLYDLVPGFSLFRIPSRFLFVTSLLGITLGGIGADELWTRLRRRSGSSRRKLLPHALMSLLMLGIVVEGVHYVRRYVEVVPAEQAVPPARYRSFFASDSSTYRVGPLVRSTMNYGWSAPFGLQLITGFDAYNYRHFLSLFETMVLGRTAPAGGATVWVDLARITRWDLLDEFNVKYLMAPRPLRSTPSHLKQVASFRDEPSFTLYRGFHRTDIHIYENQNVRQRAYWAQEMEPARDPLDAAKLVTLRNLRQFTIVEAPDLHPVSLGTSEAATVEVLEARDGALLLSTDNQERGFLVASEIWHPGWRASVDGEAAELFRTNVALMGLWVPAGTHRVELHFRPLYWNAARAISVAAAVAAAGLAVYGSRQRQAARGQERAAS